jgi:hypothetical protein
MGKAQSLKHIGGQYDLYLPNLKKAMAMGQKLGVDLHSTLTRVEH